MLKAMFTTSDGQNVIEATKTKIVEIKIGTRFYDNNACVQVYADPLSGYMTITPEAWDQIVETYKCRIWNDKEPFEKNRFLEIIGFAD